LNRTTAPQVVRLFDVCFKKGVLDCYELSDDYEARDFLLKHKSDGTYGLVYDDFNFDWRRWRFTLERWCREYRVGSIGDTYLASMHVTRYLHSYLFAVIPMTMRFYLMGVEEWLEYPNPSNIELFKHTKRIHWKPVQAHLKSIRNSDFLSYLQEFIYEKQRMNLEGDLTAKQYDSFSKAMYIYTQKYMIPYESEAEETFEE